MGDLYATCSSVLSRNYRIGYMLGQGISLEHAIKKLGQTAEGVNTILQVHSRAKALGIYMPITMHCMRYYMRINLHLVLHLI